MTKPKSHPYADLFPMMTGQELEALAADIAANGQRHPIILFNGAVLDGRNRLLACEKANVEPKFVTHEGDDASALALVISLNVQRRDLTAAQRAIIAARTLQQFPERRGRPKKQGGTHPNNGRARDEVAAEFKVGSQSVQQAKALLEEAPDLAAQVEACLISLAAAHEQLQDRRKRVAQKAKDVQIAAEYREAVSSGEMTLEEAMEELLEKQREEREKLAAEADARKNWLKQFAELLSWVESRVAERDDEHLVWYTLADSPGLYDHGITPERIGNVVEQLHRARTLTFGGQNGSAKKAGGSARSRSA